MREFFKRMYKCRIRGIHKISVSEGICIRCHQTIDHLRHDVPPLAEEQIR
ncbi:hypothetical protein NC661_19715 [Aquibacillus koreensis]|uniref:Uncharacterized protein n=1 Tax=Aquibacillus koreensis TaxID=279446 RepID=A0A9X3WMV3_9BACI|nr:hypothetical protein [Aquibacillus koreensis]MCT2534193.1 hypothetical protein [Aquibacillus koreensis]MDC3422585.1 hypothetical protein [Aquibacillus koreensis]